MSKKEKIFTTTLVLKVLYEDSPSSRRREITGDNTVKSVIYGLTPEEISKKVVKEVGKETTILTTNDATELKRILDHLRRNGYIKLIDSHTSPTFGIYTKFPETLKGYRITDNGQGLHRQAQNLMLNDPTNPLIESTIEQYLNRDQNIAGKKFQEKTAQVKNPLGMNHQEKLAYYSSQEFSRQKYLSREEYKKNKKYINKKGWGPDKIGYGGSIGETVDYKRITKAGRKRSRFDWYVIFCCMAIPIIIAIVVIYLI